MFDPGMIDPEMCDEPYSPYREPLDDLVAIEDNLKNHPETGSEILIIIMIIDFINRFWLLFAENKKLLENARDQKFEIVKDFLEEDKFPNDTRMQKYMVELEDQALLNWHLYLLRHFKRMEEPLVPGYIRDHFDFSIWQDIIEVALECKRPNMNPSKNISEQMQPFYRVCFHYGNISL